MTVTISSNTPKISGWLTVSVPNIIAIDNPIDEKNTIRSFDLDDPPNTYICAKVPVDINNPVER